VQLCETFAKLCVIVQQQRAVENLCAALRNLCETLRNNYAAKNRKGAKDRKVDLENDKWI